MAYQSKVYNNKKFQTHELSKALKKAINQFKVDINEVLIEYHFVNDGIVDSKELSFDNLGFIKILDDSTEKFEFSFKDYEGDNFSFTLQKMFESKANVLYKNDNLLEIIIFAEAEKIKRFFSILENELILNEILDNDDESLGLVEVEKVKDNDDESLGLVEVEKVKDNDETNLKKVPKEYKKSFGIIRLFLDDIIQIIQLFNDNFERYDVEIDNYKINNGKDIETVKNHINTISMEKNEDYTQNFIIWGYKSIHGLSDFRLMITDNVAIIVLKDESDVKNLGLFHKIEKILAARENKFFSISLQFKILLIIMLFSYSIAILLVYLSKIKFINSNGLVDTISNLLLILPFVFWIAISIYSHYQKNKVNFFKSDSKQNFWKRNKDTILVTGGVGLFITVIGYILNNFF